jgi:hypothetical protein
MNMKIKYIFGIIIIIMFIFFVVWEDRKETKEMNELTQKLNKEYPWLAIKDSLNSIVVDIYKMPFGSRGTEFYKDITTPLPHESSRVAMK